VPEGVTCRNECTAFKRKKFQDTTERRYICKMPSMLRVSILNRKQITIHRINLKDVRFHPDPYVRV